MFGYDKTGITCCLGCDKRKPACHDTCIKYINAKMRNEIKKKYLKEANNTSIAKSNFIGNPGNTSKHKHRKNKIYI